MKISTLCFTLLLAALLVGSASAGVIFTDSETASVANAAPAGSVWPGAPPNGAVGGIGGPVGFTMPFDGLFTLEVDDCCLVGDVYQAFIDGASQGLTSIVQLGGPTASTGTFTEFLTAGAHTFDINDQILTYIGNPDPYGGGTVPDGSCCGGAQSFSPAGLTVTGSAVSPEPGTLILMGIGLLGAAGLRRRRSA